MQIMPERLKYELITIDLKFMQQTILKSSEDDSSVCN